MTSPAGRRRTDGQTMIVLTTKAIIAMTACLVAVASVIAAITTLLAARGR